MLNKNMRRPEIDEALEGKDDFVQIDYLEKYLKQMPPIDMRKFAYLKLALIYLNRDMYVDAANSFKNAIHNTLVLREKREYGLKEAKAYILAGKFEDSDRSLKRAMGEGNSKEKEELFNQIVEFYKQEGEKLEKEGKKEKASKLYEKLIRMKIKDLEKMEVKEKLLNLYDKLGKRKEYNFLKGLEYF